MAEFTPIPDKTPSSDHIMLPALQGTPSQLRNARVRYTPARQDGQPIVLGIDLGHLPQYWEINGIRYTKVDIQTDYVRHTTHGEHTAIISLGVGRRVEMDANASEYKPKHLREDS